MVVGVDEPRRHHAAARVEHLRPLGRFGPGERTDGGDGAVLDQDVAVELAAGGVHGDDAGVADEQARHGILRLRAQDCRRMPAPLQAIPPRSPRLALPAPAAIVRGAGAGGTIMAADIGLVGLGTMGAALSLNIAEKGFAIAVFNRTAGVAASFVAEAGDLAPRITATDSLEALVAAIAPPRAIILMVPAGDPVDQMIAACARCSGPTT